MIMDAHHNINKLLQQLSAGFTAIPFNQMLGLHLDQLTPNQVAMSFKMKNELVGNFFYGILHGGVISSVLDMAGGMVVMSSIIQKNPNCTVEDLSEILSKCSTVDLQISYLRPGKGDLFITKAYLIKSGNKISFARMELYNQEDVLIAMGNGTYSR